MLARCTVLSWPSVVCWFLQGHPDSIARLQRASNFSKMQYRRLIAKLRRHLGVVETYMCANKWDEIVPTAVPSIANKHYAKAFLVRRV